VSANYFRQIKDLLKDSSSVEQLIRWRSLGEVPGSVRRCPGSGTCALLAIQPGDRWQPVDARRILPPLIVAKTRGAIAVSPLRQLRPIALEAIQRHSETARRGDSRRAGSAGKSGRRGLYSASCGASTSPRPCTRTTFGGPSKGAGTGSAVAQRHRSRCRQEVRGPARRCGHPTGEARRAESRSNGCCVPLHQSDHVQRARRVAARFRARPPARGAGAPCHGVAGFPR
jgi:hypothetical protein